MSVVPSQRFQATLDYVRSKDCEWAAAAEVLKRKQDADEKAAVAALKHHGDTILARLAATPERWEPRTPTLYGSRLGGTNARLGDDLVTRLLFAELADGGVVADAWKRESERSRYHAIAKCINDESAPFFYVTEWDATGINFSMSEPLQRTRGEQ